MKNPKTVKYIIKVVPTFSQRLGQGLLSMIGGCVGAIIFCYGCTIIAPKLKKKPEKKVTDFDEFIKFKEEKDKK